LGELVLCVKFEFHGVELRDSNRWLNISQTKINYHQIIPFEIKLISVSEIHHVVDSQAGSTTFRILGENLSGIFS